jgi:cytochrome c556
MYGHPSSINRPALTAILLGVIAWSTGPALTQPQAASEEYKETLREIMQELGAEYLRLSNALLMDDFKILEESAKAIQTHSLPDEIVAAIKTRLGRSFRAFERADEQSHRGAAALAKRAAAKDIAGSAKAFGAMTDGCVSCHKQFRATLRTLSN